MQLPERITAWREHAGLTKSELARACRSKEKPKGLTLEAVIQWEDGATTPTQDNLELIAKATGAGSLAVFYGAVPAPKKKRAS